MANRDPREAVFEAALERADVHDRENLLILLRAFWRDLSTETLSKLRPEDVVGAALSHRGLGEVRRPGECLVRVFTPTVEANGWGTRNTVVQVINDDMAFLVDSVTAALTAAGATIRFLTHPQLSVPRDAEGRLVDVAPIEEVEGAEGDEAVEEKSHRVEDQVESWIHVEVQRTTDPDTVHLLESQIRATLADVRTVYEDWEAMTKQALRCAIELDPYVAAKNAEAQQACDLLDWLADGNFVFLGYLRYRRDREGGRIPVPDSGLGLLREDTGDSALPLTLPSAREAWEKSLFLVTKGNRRTTVHRRVFPDHIVVKTYDKQGRETGHHSFLGLFTSNAYNDSVTKVPYLRDKVRAVLERAGFTREAHTGKALLAALETYPRDEMFRSPIEELTRHALAIVQLHEQTRTRLFLSKDPFGRFMSCLVYLPRDRYNTVARMNVAEILRETFTGDSVEYTTRASEEALATLHFVIHVAPDVVLPDVDPDMVEHQIVEATRDWDEDLAVATVEEFGEGLGDRYAKAFHGGFTTAYKEVFPPRVGAADLRELEDIRPGELRLNLYTTPTSRPDERRLKLYSYGRLSLSALLPVFTHLGTEVISERPYVLERSDGAEFHIYDFALRPQGSAGWGAGDSDTRARFQEAFAAAWEGRTEPDELEGLVLAAGLTSRQVVILRTVTGYLRQVGIAYSQAYLRSTLLNHPRIAAMLVRLFEVRLSPDLFAGTQVDDSRRLAEEEIVGELAELIASVPSLEQDRILRRYVEVIRGTLRTSFYQYDRRTPEDAGSIQPTVALKVDPSGIPGMPDPRPAFEIWVYGPRVEGVHLRFGKVARGGLRWSDRREDFRTEILALVKAQVVKNAVIVPTGAKGGFYPKRLPNPNVDREGWAAQGREAYATFVASLLDVTDNLIEGSVVPPPRVVRHDDDDTYLVVAADKGTAHFSDLANEIARSYGFWLDDAFASGGSAGYDHKEMGITARGAWESVKRHFRELGRDVQSEAFTVVGIGDMSGDVFGNGMLLSQHTRLVAAFDHRDIFVDPEPDAAVSFAERRRLFALSRSSWQDYDHGLISEGGGVFSRSLKTITVTDQMRAALGIDPSVETMTPQELQRAILLAPVDLLWCGGIGTYVKGSEESSSDIGDRANDAIRVDGGQLRVRVVGEGANLAFSQRGRIEAAGNGIGINTDAIDNSAGVDTSDHEVNLKIPLTALIRSGEMTFRQRDQLLVEMTDDVAQLVLEDNYQQNQVLGHSREREGQRLGAYSRLMAQLEERSLLDRELEFLPSDAELQVREKSGKGLTSPERAVLVAYVKLALKDAIAPSGLPDEAWFARELRNYFPRRIRKDYPHLADSHPLRREIITNAVANSVVNLGGMTFTLRAEEETGATLPDISRALVIAREVFDINRYMARIKALDNRISTQTQARLHRESRRLLDRATRWFLLERPSGSEVGAEIDRYRPGVAAFEERMEELLRGGERDRFHADVVELAGAGVPDDLARWAEGLLSVFAMLDVTDLAREAGEDMTEVAELYFSVSEHFAIDKLLDSISALPRDDLWDSMARSAVRADVYAAAEGLTSSVLSTTDGASEVDERLRRWLDANAAAAERAHSSLGQLQKIPDAGLAPVSVVLRHLRAISRSGSAAR
ncbi:glutamate dehydrogenase [Raineyella antarctica]|uniref:Glutamate dehydrogenase n=1 Tax=Raineyella antarctica TaxID=1577474 RepID=A0A1G6GMC6_9ACTN|nr:NAD-glutamate dehydrogenase [Raineyella antarctica]SDB83094.1 glutamate dehydrogenase [Raineyella antarctica]